MAAFDIADSSGNGYALIWKERHYLMGLAAVPILIKLFSYMVLAGLGWEQDFIKQALVMLPSYFADGWMVAHLVRLILFGQRWPFKPTGNPEKDVASLHERARGIMGGTLVYALTEYLVTGAAGLVYYYGQGAADQTPENPLLFAAGSVLVFVAILWAFRLLWLYIPAAAGYGLRSFLIKINGYSTSFYMVGVWLICMIPVFLLFRFLISIIIAPYGGDITALPMLPDFAVTVLIILMDTVIALLATAGMTFGIQEMFNTAPEQKQ